MRNSISTSLVVSATRVDLKSASPGPYLRKGDSKPVHDTSSSLAQVTGFGNPLDFNPTNLNCGPALCGYLARDEVIELDPAFNCQYLEGHQIDSEELHKYKNDKNYEYLKDCENVIEEFEQVLESESLIGVCLLCQEFFKPDPVQEQYKPETESENSAPKMDLFGGLAAGIIGMVPGGVGDNLRV